MGLEKRKHTGVVHQVLTAEPEIPYLSRAANREVDEFVRVEVVVENEDLAFLQAELVADVVEPTTR